ncbi:DNA-directed RNA polymerase subunit L [Candidatus Bathyarchaeota archaeon]|nr:DNA-directed RNA polymerase subunit L [Candidatus Bathyarchaeota archaeon]
MMKIKVLKRTAVEIELEVEGVGHSLCNLLQERLLEDQNVDLAGYDIPHPLASNPVIYIRTKRSVDPERVLQIAVQKALKMNREFKEELEKAFKT